jgi:hypothetical protein
MKKTPETYVLGNLQNQTFISCSHFNLESVQNLGELAIKLNVNDGTNDLGYLTGTEGSSSATVGTDAYYNMKTKFWCCPNGRQQQNRTVSAMIFTKKILQRTARHTGYEPAGTQFQIHSRIADAPFSFDDSRGGSW